MIAGLVVFANVGFGVIRRAGVEVAALSHYRLCAG
jgi:hypothetical protein